MTDLKMRVVCLGDSITWGWPHGTQYSWVRMLSEAVDADFINQGIPGNTMEDMLERFNRHVVKYNPTHVIIMGGGNDVLQGESRGRITWNIAKMVEMADESGIKVIFGLTPPMDYPPQERMLAALRAWMTEFASSRSIPIIDFVPAFCHPDGRLRENMLLADGAHPTRLGYEEMFKQIDLDIFK